MKFEYAVLCVVAASVMGAFAAFGHGLDADIAGKGPAPSGHSIVSMQAGVVTAVRVAETATSVAEETLPLFRRLPAYVQREMEDIAAVGAVVGLRSGEMSSRRPFLMSALDPEGKLTELLKGGDIENVIRHVGEELGGEHALHSALADESSVARTRLRAAAYSGWWNFAQDEAWLDRRIRIRGLDHEAARRGLGVVAPGLPDAVYGDFLDWADTANAFLLDRPQIATSASRRVESALEALGERRLVTYLQARERFAPRFDLGFGIDFERGEEVAQWYAPESDFEATPGVRRAVDRNLRLMRIALLEKEQALRKHVSWWGDAALDGDGIQYAKEALGGAQNAITETRDAVTLSRFGFHETLSQYLSALHFGGRTMTEDSFTTRRLTRPPFTVISSTDRFSPYANLLQGWKKSRFTVEAPTHLKQVGISLYDADDFRFHDYSHGHSIEKHISNGENRAFFESTEERIAALERAGDPDAADLRALNEWTMHEDPELAGWRGRTRGIDDGAEPAPKAPNARARYATWLAEDHAAN